jgi:hypothetical protein
MGANNIPILPQYGILLPCSKGEAVVKYSKQMFLE